MANILAIGSSGLSSSDFTVISGSPTTVHLIQSTTGNVANMPAVTIDLKGSNGTYLTIGALTSSDPARVITAAGTYRVTRISGSAPVGVDTE